MSSIKVDSSSFSLTERQLLDAVGSALAPEAREVFKSQMSAVNLVQRHPHGTIVAFYRKRWWRVNWDGVLLFTRNDEFPMAKVTFKVGGKQFKATLYCIKGHIINFNISPSPKSIWDQPFDETPTVEVIADPMKIQPVPAHGEIIPEEWKRLKSNFDAKKFSDWTLHDSQTAYRMPMDDGEYLILAERGGREFVLWKLDPASSEFHYMPEHDSQPEQVGMDVTRILSSS